MALKSDKKLISSTCIILPVLVNGRPTCRFTLHFFSSFELHQPVLYCAIQCSPMSFPRWPLQRTAAHPSIVELQKGCKTPQNGAKLPAMAYFDRSHQSAGLRQGFKFADCLSCVRHYHPAIRIISQWVMGLACYLLLHFNPVVICCLRWCCNDTNCVAMKQ